MISLFRASGSVSPWTKSLAPTILDINVHAGITPIFYRANL